MSRKEISVIELKRMKVAARVYLARFISILQELFYATENWLLAVFVFLPSEIVVIRV